MKKNGTQIKVDIACLREQVKNLKDNDLMHLRADIQEFKVETRDELREIHAKLDMMSSRISYWSGGLAVLILIINLIIIYRK